MEQSVLGGAPPIFPCDGVKATRVLTPTYLPTDRPPVLFVFLPNHTFVRCLRAPLPLRCSQHSILSTSRHGVYRFGPGVAVMRDARCEVGPHLLVDEWWARMRGELFLLLSSRFRGYWRFVRHIGDASSQDVVRQFASYPSLLCVVFASSFLPPSSALH